MLKKAKWNYRRLVLPLILGLLLCCAALLLLTGFGIRYGFVTSLPVESIPADQLKGACAQVGVTSLEGTFARIGSVYSSDEEEETAPVGGTQFCMVKLNDGHYIAVRVSGEHTADVATFSQAVADMGIDQARTLSFPLIRGTVNELPDNLYALFCNWADQYLEDSDGSEAFYEANLHKLILDGDYYGAFPQGTVIFLTILAGLLLALALALLVFALLGNFDRSVRAGVKAVGREALEKEFAEAESYAGKLVLGPEHTLLLHRFSSELFNTKDVLWAYARSRRLEGGKLSWFFVMKTADKREYSVCLGDAKLVQAAEERLKSLVSPLCTGFDKEKQALYDKDVNTFRARVKNGSI